MTFRFRLGRVLRVRTQLRQQAQEHVARTRAALAALEQRIAAAAASQAEARAAEEAASAAGCSGADLARWRSFEAAAAARERVLRRDREQLLVQLEREREALLAERQEERKLERLEERARDRFDADAAREDARLLDELALRGRGERE
ncbi:MAG: flagellar export protein FliJ [bacterium]|nr:flagellar export protein FliJ [bacterium]